MRIATLLEPQVSLFHSYLGKAFYEVKRTGLDAREYAVAKELDPKDPTPWFYDAITKQTPGIFCLASCTQSPLEDFQPRFTRLRHTLAKRPTKFAPLLRLLGSFLLAHVSRRRRHRTCLLLALWLVLWLKPDQTNGIRIGLDVACMMMSENGVL